MSQQVDAEQDDDGETYAVEVLGFTEVTVEAASREAAMNAAIEDTDFGDLDYDTGEFRVYREDEDEETRYNVFKNGELVEENKPMTDTAANKLDGHTQFNEAENDFEEFRVEEDS